MLRACQPASARSALPRERAPEPGGVAFTSRLPLDLLDCRAMTNALRTAIADLATTFAIAVTTAIRGASLDDILTLTDAQAPATRAAGRPGRATKRAKAVAPSRPTRSGGVVRRSREDIEQTLELVVALLRSTKGGLRSEQIQKHLGVRKEALPRVLKEGLTTKALRSKGEKRSTVYAAT